MAMVMIKAATEKAKEIGKSFVIAIVDESGVLKSFLRMDGAPLLSVQVAIDKAYTAVGFGMPTHQWYDFIKNDPPLALGAPSGINRLIIFGGGYPIVLNGKIVGGIGVSGGHYTEDMKVAEAALEALKKEVERSG
ncbi:cobalamin adenosyltransferase [Sulfolobus sp. A20]|nr:cobalamin adenosyltransferase [Sulfolobus sp. A20]TRM75762.1 heme-binding protein [Sulfolobus sp. A20-N-F8]TRM79608.1 heme-binding protein [Sulfolobus sp. B5]TRM80247.1 heme-binding protein [Sulfolobus sp. D5]TRM82637.1 heme-binding protein [Sulfolobus sp. A20-N-F6]TRM89537.1 heme-binding protein [Sulfolobus sp. C3]TRM98172.1 heme-binding protein [Sulfolobus sp. B1]TRM99336.1 heme-binding protein [Sulfolobus sp. F1]TRN03986.1 heme-binding protein [Sulfolobus sp. E1]